MQEAALQGKELRCGRHRGLLFLGSPQAPPQRRQRGRVGALVLGGCLGPRLGSGIPHGTSTLCSMCLPRQLQPSPLTKGTQWRGGRLFPRAPKHRALEGTLVVGFSHPQLTLDLAA